MSKPTERRSPWWITPAACAVIGAGLAGALLLGGDRAGAAKAFGFMLLVGGFFAAAGRSELVRVLRGDARDERSARIEIDAMALTGIVLSSTTLALLLYEWANERSGSPYVQLSVIGALTFAAVYAVRMRHS